MGLMFSAKCPSCWERFDNCNCCKYISRCKKCFMPANQCTCEIENSTTIKSSGKELGRIAPVKAYKTTDGRLFTGKNAQEDAEDHQRWLNGYYASSKIDAPKTPLKKRKRKRRPS